MRLIPEPWTPQGAMATPSLHELPWSPGSPPHLLLIRRSDPAVQRSVDALAPLLAPEEHSRLTRLQRLEDRERFLLGRGVLRLVIGAWLGLRPETLELSTGTRGKPELRQPDAHPPGQGRTAPGPRFNVSHSGDLILLGFHPLRPVGVDVEQKRAVPEWEAIARRCLPAGHWEALRTLPEEQRSDAFLEAWCRLEADLKARGHGLFHSRPTDGGDPAPPPSDLWAVSLPEGYLGAAALV
jgi:4'-phosphopantetheinyl transferase